MKKHSFFAATKQKIDQIQKKIEEKFIRPLFISKSIDFKSPNDHQLSKKN